MRMDGVNTNQEDSKYINPVVLEHDMLSLRGGAVLVIIGIILFFIGVIIGQFLMFAGGSTPAKVIYVIGRLFALIGDLIIIVPLYIIGITSHSLEWKIRATMISSGTALLIVTMILGISTISPYMYMYG